MQLQLPIFPAGTHMISDRLGFYVKDDMVQYIINGLPAYAHGKSDHQSSGLSPVILLIWAYARRLRYSGLFM